jgi:hypothetical protein
MDYIHREGGQLKFFEKHKFASRSNDLQDVGHRKTQTSFVTYSTNPGQVNAVI